VIQISSDLVLGMPKSFVRSRGTSHILRPTNDVSPMHAYMTISGTGHLISINPKPMVFISALVKLSCCFEILVRYA
jgi:hypothetical protein